MAEKEYVTLRVEMDIDLYEQIKAIGIANGCTPEELLAKIIEDFVKHRGVPIELTADELERARTQKPRVRVYEIRQDENGNEIEVSLD